MIQITRTAAPSEIVGRQAARPAHLLPAPFTTTRSSGTPAVGRPSALTLPSSKCNPLERKPAFGNAGLRARASEFDQRATAQRPGAGFPSPRIDPSNRAPAAPAPTATFESSHVDPLNRAPAAPAPNAA